MINNDSIVTAYDEHLTLVEWLQKVEKALDNAVLTNLGIAKLSDQDNVATYQVTATFADNTTIVSDTFTLPSTDIVTAFSNLTTLVNGFDTRITDNTNNIAKALFTPSSAPTTRKVVTIDTNGAQDNVDGTELTILMSNIVDSHGNPRFIEGNITMETIEGVTQTYGKWSLSGTHLMIVLCGTIANGTRISPRKYADVVLPRYINDKIKAIAAGYIIYRKANYLYTEQAGTTEALFEITKIYNGVRIETKGDKTADNDLSFRIQFDLLIDSE